MSSSLHLNTIRCGIICFVSVDSGRRSLTGLWSRLWEWRSRFRYRNKAQYPIGVDKEGNPVAGFYAGRTHSIIANTECLLGVDENRTILEAILQYMKEYSISAYEEASGKGLVRHVLIRKGFTSGEIMVCLVINPEHMKGRTGIREKNSKREWLPHQKELIERLGGNPGYDQYICKH